MKLIVELSLDDMAPEDVEVLLGLLTPHKGSSPEMHQLQLHLHDSIRSAIKEACHSSGLWFGRYPYITHIRVEQDESK